MSEDNEKAILEELHAQHDRLVVAKTPLGAIACSPPERATYQKFLDGIGDPTKSNTDLWKKLIYECRQHPDTKQLRPILDRYPALLRKLADALGEAAGGEIMVTAEADDEGNPVATAEVDGARVVCRAPKGPEHQRCLAKVNDGRKSTAAAWAELMLCCGVSHKGDEMKAIIDRYPGLPLQFFSVLDDLAGGDIELTVGK